MSNEIYPHSKYKHTTRWVGDPDPVPVELSVNQRLAPIFKALADDPEGWEYESFDEETGWSAMDIHTWWRLLLLPMQTRLDYFRLAPKRKTITVEIPVPDHVSNTFGNGGTIHIRYDNKGDSDNRVFEADKLIQEAIHKAMEGK